MGLNGGSSLLTAARVGGRAEVAVASAGPGSTPSSSRVMAGFAVVAIVGSVGGEYRLSERSRRGHQCSRFATTTASRLS